jgi:Zn-dependent protease with chaperone function
MSTDFFERQDHARRLTTRLLVLFALAVLTIILAVYVALALATAYAGPGVPPARHAEFPDLTHVERVNPPREHRALTLWQPKLFLGVVLGVLLVIALGSLYKISELSAGGETVALMLGGRTVDPQTRDLAERRLLNVVEEMALASGVPVPPVFVLDHEPGINAFAAGHQPGDAVVAVSAGCLRYLNREELQGVAAHEFSHILNGDMRLNLRLIGIVYGILVLAVIGYYTLRSAGSFSSGRSRKSDGAAGIFLAGLVLLILGYLGVFLGKLIKSAINRQREFLADASAVQFTRYPGGIAGALKKIGGLTEGSRIRDGHAEEISHMFFGDAFAGSFFNLFATHPPLAARIRALEPDFDGRFPPVQPTVITAADVAGASRTGWPPGIPLPAAGPLEAVVAAQTMPFSAGDMVQRIGQMHVEDLHQAGRMISGMPPSLLEAAREPFAAPAVIFALLLSRDDEALRNRQLQMLQRQIAPSLYQETQRLMASAQSLAAAARLPLVDLAIPALKRSSAGQYAQFRNVVEDLVHADSEVDLFEYCLRMVLFGYLDVHFGLKKPPPVRYQTFSAAAQPVRIVLSTLAHVGQKDPAAVLRAFQAGVGGRPGQLDLLPREQCTLRTFDAALSELASASPRVKREIITAATACIAADDKVTLEESELLRAVAALLACPIPPRAAVVDAG